MKAFKKWRFWSRTNLGVISEQLVAGYAAYEISAQDMKHELSHHGPVNAIFSVYEDFFHYKSGKEKSG